MHLPTRLVVCATAALAATASINHAGTPVAAQEPPLAADLPETGLEKFNDWDIAGILFPHIHAYGIGGASTGDPAELATGGHDPRREGFSAQAIEPGLSLRTKYLEGFANYLWFQDESGDWDGELEEAFGKIVNLPGGFELKGGQYLARFGSLNNKHLHAWEFVDSEMVLSRFLGDDGLLLRGGELSWTLPLGMDPGFVSIASFGFGETRPHSHDHGHDDHGDGHEDEPAYEADEATLADNVFTARLMGRYRFSDFHTLTGGVSWAGGDNGFGKSTNIGGIDIEYQWRERGLEPGGMGFRWRNEFLWRDVDAIGTMASADDHADEHADEHGHEDAHDDAHAEEGESISGNFNETGLYSTATFTWNEYLDTSLRVGWVEGIDAFGLEERLRISPAISCWADSGRRLGLRVQYNYDNLESGDDEHSVWFQVSIALGSIGEVR